MTELHLIPMPKRLLRGDGALILAGLENLILPSGSSGSLLAAAHSLADELEVLLGKRLRFACSEIDGAAIRLIRRGPDDSSEAYRMRVSRTGIRVEAGAETGLFYGIQTLRQLIRSEGAELPALEIDDAPDYPARGFYHDCTRGKVPTLETLFRLADKLAYYKLNQLQLYVEHTFAFARHSDMWSGADPLTAEEILRLDRHCRERHIDLVPSISTFGHFYMGLRSRRKKHLNELPIDASRLPFSFYDRMAHYTLNATDPGSLRLIEEMLAEFLPLFGSRFCNICCDETFDLGKGKNAARCAAPGGAERLYFEFLTKIIAAVKKHEKTAMFWGDIIAKAPELIRQLPPDTIPLEWDYSEEAKRNDTAIMRESGLRFYVCPGVAGWSTFLNRINAASKNIVNYARKGLRFGAAGMLNTDWGDFGHVNPLGCSFHGLALGAACAWNCRSAAAADAFDRAFSTIEFGDPSGEIVAAWRELDAARTFTFRNLEPLFDPANSEETRNFLLSEYRKFSPAAIRRFLETAAEAERRILAACRMADFLDPLAGEEIVAGVRGSILVNETLGAILRYDGFEPRGIADRLRAFETRFSSLWHRRNKPSEYYRVRELFMQIADFLDGMEPRENGSPAPEHPQP